MFKISRYIAIRLRRLAYRLERVPSSLLSGRSLFEKAAMLAYWCVFFAVLLACWLESNTSFAAMSAALLTVTTLVMWMKRFQLQTEEFQGWQITAIFALICSLMVLLLAHTSLGPIAFLLGVWAIVLLDINWTTLRVAMTTPDDLQRRARRFALLRGCCLSILAWLLLAATLHLPVAAVAVLAMAAVAAIATNWFGLTAAWSKSAETRAQKQRMLRLTRPWDAPALPPSSKTGPTRSRNSQK